MKKNYKSCMLGSIITTAALLIGTQAFAAHTEAIPLLDSSGSPITVGGGNDNTAYSAKATCGACHDYDGIERHTFHAQLGANEHKGWNPFSNGNWPSGAAKGKAWVQSAGHVGKW
jgi:hypothetical protein